jgi:membrane protein implicated in regulation of membrane protease activity
MFIWIGMTAASVFGKRVSAKLAKLIGLVLFALAAVALVALAITLIRRDAVDEYKDERAAEIANAVVGAEREANAEKAERDTEFANSQANIMEGIDNAIAHDPNQGTTPVGPAQQSYFDGLRRERDR